MERGPLSLMSTTEELLGRNSSGFGLESREYGHRDSSRWPCGTLYPQKKWALTSLTSGGRSVGIVRLRTEATEFFFLFIDIFCNVGKFLKDSLKQGDFTLNFATRKVQEYWEGLKPNETDQHVAYADVANLFGKSTNTMEEHRSCSRYLVL
jgi:hypothetical protein